MIPEGYDMHADALDVHLFPYLDTPFLLSDY